MEIIQDGRHAKEVIGSLFIGIVCLTHMIAEIDTNAHYIYFVRRILSYVAFCICSELNFNLSINSAFVSVKAS